MRKSIIFISLLFLFTGVNFFIINSYVSDFYGNTEEKPNTIDQIQPVNTVSDTNEMAEIMMKDPLERDSPHNRIDPKDIHIYENKIVIDILDARIAGFADTNSMDPVIDIESNAIQIEPQKTSDVFVGDIISFETKYSKGRIIHRVIEIGTDENGWYAITRGDNMDYTDPEKVRFESIKRILIGILY